MSIRFIEAIANQKRININRNNLVTIDTVDKLFFQLQLSPYDYQQAIDAHKRNKTILINGVLEKEKTQYKVTELKKFMIVS